MPEINDLDRDGLPINIETDSTATLRVAFSNENDAPMAFTGRLSGSGAPFATFDSPSVTVGGGRRGSLEVTFSAKEAGLFDLGIEVMDADGFVVDPPGRRTVSLVVKGTSLPPAEPGPSAPSSKPVEVEPPDPSKAKSMRNKPAPSLGTSPPPAETTPAASLSGVPLSTMPTPGADPAQPSPERAPEVLHPVASPPSKPQSRIIVELPEEKPKPAPAPEATEPEVVVFQREFRPAPEPPKPTPEPERSRIVIDMGEPSPVPTTQHVAPRAKTYDPQNYSKVLRNLRTNDVLELPPGGKALVLLDFENRGEAEATYVLMVKDDLRPTEDFAYARILMGQVNIGAGGTDELAFEILVPENAPPQTLRIRASHGRREGQRDLEVSKLTLKVMPRIATRLSAAQSRVVVGPLNRVPELSLLVSNDGNVETAYRLRVKNPAEVPAEAKPGEYPDIETRDGWHFLFDKEAEDLRLDGTVAARLRLLRTGIWWLGWWETARVKAVVVPVTDPRNAGRDGNVVDLVGTRWRILPMPWPLAVPILLAFFAVFLGAFGVRDVQVENALVSDENIAFVLQPSTEGFKADPSRPNVPITAKISWSAPVLSQLKIVSQDPGAKIVRTSSGTADVTHSVRGYGGEPSEQDQFRVTSILGLGGASSNRVVFLPMRTTDAFSATFQYAGADGTRRGFSVAPPGSANPPLHSLSLLSLGKPRTVKGAKMLATEMVVSVAPGERIYVTPSNSAEGNEVQVWRLTNPQDYSVGSLKENGYTTILPHADGATWQFLPKAGRSGSGPDDLWVVTTDSLTRAFHIIINRGGSAR